MSVFEDNPKNLYVIKHKLSELEFSHGRCIYYVGNFYLKISPHKYNIIYGPADKGTRVTHYEHLDVQLCEIIRDVNGKELERSINIDIDPRFINYKPIKYNTTQYYWSAGTRMPILILCELIKYLHRLSNLAVFI